MADAPTIERKRAARADGARPPRVVFLNPTGILGGAERCLLDLMASIRDADPSVAQYLIASDDGPLLPEAERLGVTVELVPLPPALAEIGDSGISGSRLGAALRFAGTAASVRRYGRRVREAVARFEPTVVHSNGVKFHMLSGIVGSLAAPVVWHVRDLIGARPLVATALRLLSRRAARAIAISEIVRDDLRRALPRVPVDVVYDAIDTDHFAPGPGDGSELDRLAGLDDAPEGTLRVGLVATYGRWKGQDLFLRAVSRMPAERDGRLVRYFVVGGPVYRTKGSQFSEAELRSIASSLGVEARVGFVGFREEIAELYRALDVVVHASTRPEPFGRTIAEAMACARPVVVARESGAAELFRDGEDAVTFDTGNADDLASAVTGLLDDAGARARIASSARARAVEVFSRPRIGRRMIEIYSELASAARVRD